MTALITDRTQADVERAWELNTKGWAAMNEEERAEWSTGLKGAYNYTDLNRVESAVAGLAQVFHLTVEVKTDWTARDVPGNADMERYLANIRKLKAACPGLADTPPVPDAMAGLDYRGANAIEQILQDLEIIVGTWFYSGQLYCGEA